MKFARPTAPLASPYRIVFFLLLTVIFASLTPCELSAQRNRGRKDKRRVEMGDIIRFEDRVRFKEGVYVLVLDVSRHLIKYQRIDDQGEFKTEQMPTAGIVFWGLINRLEKVQVLKPRRWKSQDGKFEIKATMKRIEEDKVRLEKEDGKSMAVAIDRLSQKDQDYIERNREVAGTTKANPFDVEESEDFPDDVLDLIDRRKELMERDMRHQRLAKLYMGWAIGDIIRFERFGSQDNSEAFGIVVNPGFFSVVETVDEFGELEKAQGISKHGAWTFYDRQFVPVPLLPRKWKSANEKFDIKATFVESNGDDVVLKTEDGKRMTIALSKLCETDNQFVKRIQRRVNIRNDEQLLAERETYGEELQLLLERRKELLADASLNYEVARDSFKMKGIRVRTGPINLPDLSLSSANSPDDSFAYGFPLRVPEHAWDHKVCYARDSKLVAISCSGAFSGKPTLAIVDAENQEVFTNEGSDDVGHEGEVIAISPSGKTLLVASRVAFDRQVELWRFNNGNLTKHGTVAYDSFFTPRAHLASDDCGIIVSTEGYMTFFDITDRIKPTHQLFIGRIGLGNGFQVSGGDGNVVFLYDRETAKLYGVDVLTKKCVGGVSFTTERNSIHSFAQVNPDGESAVFVEPNGLSLYSLKTSKKISEQEFDGLGARFGTAEDQFQFLGSNIVLKSNGSIFDLQLGLEVGKVKGGYQHDAKYFPNATRLVAELDRHRGRGGFGGNTIGGRKGSRADRVNAINAMREQSNYEVVQAEIRVERLPIEDIVDFALSVKESDIVNFGKGDSLAISIDIGRNERLADELHDHVADVMADGDIDIDRRSDFLLELKFVVGKKKTQKFRIRGFGPPTMRTATLTPKTCSAVLTYKGERIWSRSKSASLNVLTEEGLDRNIKLAQEMTAEDLFEFDYPVDLREMIPSRKGEFRWE